MKVFILCLVLGVVTPLYASNACSDDLTVTYEDKVMVSTELAAKDKSNNYGADRAHLNTTQKKDKGVMQMGGWVAEKNDFNQYIQIQLKDAALVRGITTQGRNGCCQQWVNKYRVMYSEDCKTWHTVGGFNVTDAFFTGNSDEDTPVTNMFHCPTMAKCIRINPLGWNNNIAMRVGLLGCQLNLNGASSTPGSTAGSTAASTAASTVASTAASQTPQPAVTTQKIAQMSSAAPVSTTNTNKGAKRGKCITDCIKRANGDYPSCKGCGYYVTCNWGIMYASRPCVRGTFWDDNLKRCGAKKPKSGCP